MLKVVTSSPAGVSSSQCLLEQDTKLLIALRLCPFLPTLHSQLSCDIHTYAYELLHYIVFIGICAEQIGYTHV